MTMRTSGPSSRAAAAAGKEGDGRPMMETLILYMQPVKARVFVGFPGQAGRGHM
jgi:hypothetical protein